MTDGPEPSGTGGAARAAPVAEFDRLLAIAPASGKRRVSHQLDRGESVQLRFVTRTWSLREGAMKKPRTEMTPQGPQFILPGAERKTARGTVHSQEPDGQLLLGETTPVSDEERLSHMAKTPLRAKKGQKPLPESGLFGGKRTGLR